MSGFRLPADLVAMIAGGVSVIVGSRDAAMRPSLMRAVGSQVDTASQRITVYLARGQSRQLLQDLAATGEIAVVFSQPSTHRTLQVKASRLEIRAADPGDQAVLATYLQAMEHEIQQVGFGPPVTRAMLAHRHEDVVAVSFVPEQAFDQTPGPRAGAALGERGLTALQGVGELRACFEGAIPAMLATCSQEGVPNVAYISQVFYVDDDHVALSFQFFNKTRQNILANPHATALLLDPRCARFYRLRIRYLRTETEGPLFEGMRAQLAGIASHSGMQGVFRLLGSDVYRVEEVEALEGEPLPLPPPRAGLLGGLRRASERLARSTGLDEALNAVLASLGDFLGVRHAMVLMLDPGTERLYTVASAGYATSGVGSEVRVGQGVIGVAARERTPVRIGYVTNAALYNQAMRSSFEAQIPDIEPVTEIPYPGLAEPHSQLAVPIQNGARLIGVLFVESPSELQFSFEDEDALVALAGHLGAAIEGLQQPAAEVAEPPPAPARPAAATGTPLVVRHFAANESIFVGDAYLIKGVAGAILWSLLRQHQATGRDEFTNRELRLDPALRLPDVTDNLEARLLLLQRRLDEHGAGLRMEKTGRGRFRLVLSRPVELVDS